MNFTASFELTNFDEALIAVIREATAEAAAQLRAAVRDQFLTEGRAYDTPWLPRKTRRGQLPDNPILFRTGRLFRSLTDPSDPEHIEELTPEGLLFGTAVGYAAYHQRGTRRMPARPILTPSMLGA
jgi:phage gpG-like protein